jgi:peptidoglycan/LPS O-acetylase OafA/YrhL
MLLIPFLEGVKYALPLGLGTSYAIAFSLFVFSLINWRHSPLVGYPIIWIGKVSYSAYFAHFLVLHFLPPLHLTEWPVVNVVFAYIIVVIVTVGISSATYWMIEQPPSRQCADSPKSA